VRVIYYGIPAAPPKPKAEDGKPLQAVLLALRAS
jgi:hypothetical protein